MELYFDIRGNLKPDRINPISVEEFETIFVQPFNESSSRHQLFINYRKYLDDLYNLTNKSFYQWIDGSFVSNKKNPKDIDLVSIVDYQDYEKNKTIFEREFISFNARRHYKVDAYIVPDYPEKNPKYIFTQSDLLYWRNLFSKTKVNRSKRQFEKGIIQINFRKDG